MGYIGRYTAPSIVDLESPVSVDGTTIIENGVLKNVGIDGIKLKSSGDSITKSDGTTAVLSESGGIVTLTADDLVANGTSSLDGAVVVNESGADVDFRVESDNVSNMLVVDAGKDTVGIRHNGDSETSLSIKSTGSRSNLILLEDENVGDGSYTPYYQYKVAYIAGNSSNTQLTIPFKSRNYNQTGYLKIRVLPAIRNVSIGARVATAEFALNLSFPNVISVAATLSSSGNFSSATGSGTNLLINFSGNYSDASMSGAFIHIEFFSQQGTSGGIDWANIAFN